MTCGPIWFPINKKRNMGKIGEIMLTARKMSPYGTKGKLYIFLERGKSLLSKKYIVFYGYYGDSYLAVIIISPIFPSTLVPSSHVLWAHMSLFCPCKGPYTLKASSDRQCLKLKLPDSPTNKDHWAILHSWYIHHTCKLKKKKKWIATGK